MKITKAYLKETLQRLAKQVVFNLSGTLVDMFVLWICSDYLLNGYAGEYLLSPFISFECACATNFTMSSHFVWGDRMKGCNKKDRFRRYLGYNLSCTGVFLLKMGFLLLASLITKKDVLVCNLIALLFTGLLNFIINDNIIFRKQTALYGNETSNPDTEFPHASD